MRDYLRKYKIANAQRSIVVVLRVLFSVYSMIIRLSARFDVGLRSRCQ